MRVGQQMDINLLDFEEINIFMEQENNKIIWVTLLSARHILLWRNSDNTAGNAPWY